MSCALSPYTALFIPFLKVGAKGERADDVLDRRWEMEQHREMDELQRSFHKSTPGCFAFLSRPHPSSEKVRPSLPVTRPMMSVDFANPGMLSCKIPNNMYHLTALGIGSP